ncbi:diol dehydratase small subunit [Clostridium thailandense]|uniref:Diol dehydratase small subunit n=1 Tax=Clostridium thailandense TaxID=2794346 RepID=A0A949WS78_9CLOT|nr:diol dehydratase small subunit [Clostridium thailandense]MBV7274791.1 diol dehydratase small subunit [Clostridium thailandense]MCH5137252.1 diol dehydratase small subunit [Clostridiaceae bacterium UIB06]
MDNNALIEQIVNQVLQTMTAGENKAPQSCENKCTESLTKNDYPLGQKRSDLIKTKNGKGLKDINIDNVLNGSITPDDIKITPEVLLYQAQIAESVGRVQFARNLRRAAELTAVPDARVLEIYNALRPYRSTKQELLDIANELENKYNAKTSAALVREACEIYEKRNRLKV